MKIGNLCPLKKTQALQITICSPKKGKERKKLVPSRNSLLTQPMSQVVNGFSLWNEEPACKGNADHSLATQETDESIQ
jgi:hypothetical protein